MSLLGLGTKSFVTSSGFSSERIDDNTIYSYAQFYMVALDSNDNMVAPPNALNGSLGIPFQIQMRHTDTFLTIQLRAIIQVIVLSGNPNINVVFV